MARSDRAVRERGAAVGSSGSPPVPARPRHRPTGRRRARALGRRRVAGGWKPRGGGWPAAGRPAAGSPAAGRRRGGKPRGWSRRRRVVAVRGRVVGRRRWVVGSACASSASRRSRRRRSAAAPGRAPAGLGPTGTRRPVPRGPGPGTCRGAADGGGPGNVPADRVERGADPRRRRVRSAARRPIGRGAGSVLEVRQWRSPEDVPAQRVVLLVGDLAPLVHLSELGKTVLRRHPPSSRRRADRAPRRRE